MSYHKSWIAYIFIAIFIAGCSSKSQQPPSGYKSSTKTSATMRPYSINGKTYYPEIVSVGDTQKGLASWYGPDFHGKKTSNGETYNMHDMTAAHKTYPMHTMVKVLNLQNNKSIVVRINDRGPFVSGRVIDLSKKGAVELGVYAKGTAPVKLEVVGFSGHTMSKGAPKATFTGGTFMVQIGSFRREAGALEYKNSYHNKFGYAAIVREFEFEGAPIYRVFLKGFRSEDEAMDFAKNSQFVGAFIVRE